MNIEQFLTRVVAPGSFVAVAFKKPDDKGMRHRFFPRDKIGDAAGYVRWCSKTGMDVWYGVASYRLATVTGSDNQGKQKFVGSRTQENVEQIRCLWYDADIKRPGDHKVDGKAYADWPELVAWVRSFTSTTGLPLPNLWLSSGYGAHLYWVLEDSLSRADWQPYAEAFKAALIATGAKGDIGLTSDSARILRPPETNNYKVPTAPAPTQVLSSLSRGDYPNQLILQALQPYMSALPQAVNYGSALAGPPPALARTAPSSMAQAAQSNMPVSRRDYHFAEIAKKCDQVKRSLATNGNGDAYDLWYLGFLSLAHFCTDGETWAHEISKGDPRYQEANVEAHLQRIAGEHDRKKTGAPTCSKFNEYRQGVCPNCPHWGKVASPFTLGIEDGDLPDRYRRNGQAIQRMIETKDGAQWVDLLPGDVYAPTLDRIGDDRKLTFVYDRAGRTSSVVAMQSNIPVDTHRAQALFGLQGVTLYDHNAKEFGRFIVAWIDKLRDMRAERDDPVPAFGWMTKGDGEYVGFAVGGTLYKPDGTEEPAPGGDNALVDWFKPRGSLSKWRQACDLVAKGRPDLQILIAVAFASPLIEFTGQAGVVISGWSQDSAVGKSSSLQVGTAVWSSPKAMMHHDDTLNSVHYRTGNTKVMPAYWDEIRIKKGQESEFVDTLFRIGQGREKARLNSDVTLKSSGDWKTAVVVTGNRKLMDTVMKERGDTNAGALRLFEFELAHPEVAFDPSGSLVIAQTQKHYGHAGRKYAAYLAQNIEPIRSLVASTQDSLQRRLGVLQSERFFVAAMATIVVGTTVSNGIGLTDFDIPSMYNFMAAALTRLREERASNVPVLGTRGFDVETALGQFLSDQTGCVLRTRHLSRPGPSSQHDRQNILQAPMKTGRLVVHVGVHDRRMLIDKNELREWCLNKNISALDMVGTMKVRWGATERRGLIGSGTPYVGGKVALIDLPLTTPDIEVYVTGGAPS